MDCQSLNNFLCKIAKWRWPSFTIPECWRPSQVYTNKSYNFKTKRLQILFSLQHLGYDHNVLRTQRRWQNSVTTLWHLSQHTANTNRVKTPNNPNNFLWNTIKLIYTNPLSKKINDGVRFPTYHYLRSELYLEPNFQWGYTDWLTLAEDLLCGFQHFTMSAKNKGISSYVRHATALFLKRYTLQRYTFTHYSCN